MKMNSCIANKKRGKNAGVAGILTRHPCHNLRFQNFSENPAEKL
jgi:hypothetical protein